MKIKIALLLSLFIMALPSPAQESCSKYYLLEDGADFRYVKYSKDGNKEGAVHYKVHDVTHNDQDTEAWMKVSHKDTKGNELFYLDYSFNCIDDGLEIDYESIISNEILKQYKGKKMETSGTDIILPNNLKVGQKLEDANVAIRIDMGGSKLNFKVDLINRSVEKQESIATSAGTFDCYVIYSERVSKLMIQQTFQSRLWLAEGIGMIKQETYDKGGNVKNSMVLTQYSN